MKRRKCLKRGRFLLGNRPARSSFRPRRSPPTPTQSARPSTGLYFLTRKTTRCKIWASSRPATVWNSHTTCPNSTRNLQRSGPGANRFLRHRSRRASRDSALQAVFQRLSRPAFRQGERRVACSRVCSCCRWCGVANQEYRCTQRVNSGRCLVYLKRHPSSLGHRGIHPCGCCAGMKGQGMQPKKQSKAARSFQQANCSGQQPAEDVSRRDA